MRTLRVTLLAGALVTFLIVPARSASALDASHISPGAESVLAPVWGSNIRQWADTIQLAARKHQLDPDLIAAIIQAESHGDPAAISVVGAVGLMGIMPVEAGFEWRPTTNALMDPYTNLDWGTAILADILRQAGGDVFTALAAYNGGWYQIDGRVPQGYATEVLDYYGRAVAARSGVSPDLAASWTIGVRLIRGNIPPQSLLLSRRPYGAVHTYGGHLLVDYSDGDGGGLQVWAYAVPIGLVAGAEAEGFGASDAVEAPILERLDQAGSVKLERANPHILLACLPALDRLRGRGAATPSNCPPLDR